MKDSIRETYAVSYQNERRRRLRPPVIVTKSNERFVCLRLGSTEHLIADLSDGVEQLPKPLMHSCY